MTRFEFLDKELEKIYIENKFISRKNVVDKLVKIYLKDSNECFLLHIEIQGDARRTFSNRMFRYFYLIREKYNLPISAMAIISGSKRPSVKTFRSKFRWIEANYKYHIYQVCDQPDEVLLKSKNPFALVVLAAKKASMIRKMTDEEIMRDFELIARRIESLKLTAEQHNIMYVFLRECLSFENPKNYATFNHKLEIITKKTNPMGVKEYLMEIGEQKGRQEGRQEANNKFVRELLIRGDSTSQIANIVGVSEAYVRKVKRTLKS